eukprot:2571672-Alexandrium_andersonii.AAC.1
MSAWRREPAAPPPPAATAADGAGAAPATTASEADKSLEDSAEQEAAKRTRGEDGKAASTPKR